MTYENVTRLVEERILYKNLKLLLNMKQFLLEKTNIQSDHLEKLITRFIAKHKPIKKRIDISDDILVAFFELFQSKIMASILIYNDLDVDFCINITATDIMLTKNQKTTKYNMFHLHHVMFFLIHFLENVKKNSPTIHIIAYTKSFNTSQDRLKDVNYKSAYSLLDNTFATFLRQQCAVDDNRISIMVNNIFDS